MNRRTFLIGTALLITSLVFAQAEKKRASVIRTTDVIHIDGVLDEAAWAGAPVASSFIQQSPFNGGVPALPTEVRFLYDNTGLYIGVTLVDPHPDSILTQLGLRDSDNLNADFFTLVLNPFNEGLTGFAFKVYASDVQVDYKITEEDQTQNDLSWDAVWQSKASITPDGWIVEMKIPWSALRFPKTSVQEWGMNCVRDIRRIRERSTWNFIDARVKGTLNQQGILDGLSGIKPPLRLSLTPYLSGYLEKSPGEDHWQFSYNYGADLKYGINQSFTLDMTIIPDFGQTASDDKIYNFSPFEIKYSEKRQFFTEGTELFDKGGIFYTRRVGSQPDDYYAAYAQADTHEIVKENPGQTNLINATKISGRTDGGLGIGVFNGMSANTWAVLEDTLTGERRRFLTQGFTNYSMLVLDQALANNSYFSVLNTNLYRADIGSSDNVTGIDFRFANRPYSHAVSGNLFVSQKYRAHLSPEFGFAAQWSAGKISGNFQYGYSQKIQNATYDPNGMGYNARNNLFENEIVVKYNVYDPFWKLLYMYNTLSVEYSTMYEDLSYTGFEVYFSSMATTTKYFTLWFNADVAADGYDYYEPRVDGWKYNTPGEAYTRVSFSSDYRKIFALDGGVSASWSSRYQSSYFDMKMAPRLRPSDRLFFTYEFFYARSNNDAGYVLDSLDAAQNQVILFGRRDVNTISNVLEASYMFRSNISLNLRIRHYWVWAHYLSFYRLRPDGYLDPVDYSGQQDVDYNSFNLDLGFIWDFAPGSQLSVMWKNAIYTQDSDIDYNFFRNLGNTFESPASNSFSIRVLYYLDALYFKKKRKVSY